jgi:2-methylcitrate dehydratase
LAFASEIAAALPALARLVDRDAAALRLADTAACALAAEALETDGTMARMRRLPLNVGRSAIWATGDLVAVHDAALRNSVAQRYLDSNDTYVGRAVTHPSDMIAVLVAMAEARGLAWSKLLEGVTVSYEVLCRLADHAQLGSRGFDGSTLTPLGAAAGAAWLAGLDGERTAEAISIAALDAGVLRSVRQGRLSDWKAIASGRGADKGLFAVEMVEAGCHAPQDVFEGKEGFFERVSGPMQIDTGGEPRLPRALIKKYPVQIFIQGLVDLAQQLRPQLAGRAVESVTIALAKQPIEMIGGGRGTSARLKLNRETADHSPGFAVGAIFETGRLSHEDYDALLGNERVLALMGSVRLEEDPEATKRYPARFPAKMTATLSGGAQVSAAQEGPAPMDSASFAKKLDELWPASRPRAWPWKLAGDAPKFPG